MSNDNVSIYEEFYNELGKRIPIEFVLGKKKEDFEDTKEYDNYIKPCKGCNQIPTVKCLKSRLETGNC